MPYAASLVREPQWRAAVEAACAELQTQLAGARPDLVFAFVSHDHAANFDDIAERVHQLLEPRCGLGCGGEMIAGTAQEIESGPVISLFAACLPGSELETFQARFERTADGIVCTGLPESAEGQAAPRAVFLLADPFSTVPNSLLSRFADEFPSVPVLGGMASGGFGPGQNALFFNGECIRDGAIGVVVRGGPAIRSVVSQGCRPVGTHYIVTRAAENLIFDLGGLPALERVQELVQSLPPQDLEMVRGGLHLGIAINEYQETFERGDFLIANVAGGDPDRNALVLANRVRVGQTVQFHVRDAQAADEDLRQLLEQHRRKHKQPPHAALLFSCNGRGTRMFPAPHHDALCIRDVLGKIPLAGFFAQGEFGPIGGENYIHGFTASIALFE